MEVRLFHNYLEVLRLSRQFSNNIGGAKSHPMVLPRLHDHSLNTWTIVLAQVGAQVGMSAKTVSYTKDELSSIQQCQADVQFGEPQ